MAVRLDFKGPRSASTQLRPGQRLPGVKNYYYSGGRERTRVPTFAEVFYDDLYDGVDLRVYEGGDLIEYDFLVSPGADVGSIVVECAGIKHIALAPDGSLEMHTEAGVIKQTPPSSWTQDADGSKLPVASGYCILTPTSYGLWVEGWDGTESLVIDPAVVFDTLLWSTYLGGGPDTNQPPVETGYDIANDVVVAQYGTASGQITVVGETDSVDFHVTPGLAGNPPGGGFLDAFVTRLNSSGTSLIYSTYIGTGCGERATAVDLAWDPNDSSKNPTWAVVTGNKFNGAGCASTLPTQGAWDACTKATPGSMDAFVLMLDVSGVLQYYTYLGGEGNDFGDDIKVSPLTGEGAEIEVYVCGWTTDGFGTPACATQDYPATPTAFTTTYQGGQTDGFVTKLRLALNRGPLATDMIYSSFLGGTGEDRAIGLAVDSENGHCVVTGYTTSVNFPTRAPTGFSVYSATRSGLIDAFVSRFDTAASGLASLPASTYLGGTSGANIQEVGSDLVIHGSYNPDPANPGDQVVTVVGTTDTTDFPTTAQAQQGTYGGGSADAFVTRLDQTFSSLVWSTYLGGDDEDRGNAICVVPSLLVGASNRKVTICGATSSSNFPTKPTSGANQAYDQTWNGGIDVFVSRFGANGGLARSTYVGGEFTDCALGISPDGERDVVVCGYTTTTESASPPFPITAGVVQTTYAGGPTDAFVLKLRANMTPFGQ